MRKATLFLVASVAALGNCLALGQEPAPLFPDVLQQLQNPATHDAAIERLKHLQESDLAAAFDTAGDKSLSQAVRQDLAKVLPKAIENLADARRARDKAEDDAYDPIIGTEAYKQYGNRDPKWDTAALKALANNTLSSQSYELFKSAVDLGCDDPMIRYYYVIRANDFAHLDQATALGQLAHVLPAMDKSKYPPARKLFAHARYLAMGTQGALMAMEDADAERAFNDTVAILPDVPRSLPALSQVEITDILWTATQRIWADRKSAFDHFYAPVHAAFPHNAIVAHIQASFYIDWAWDARGTGYAPTVSDQGWRQFDARLAQAREVAVAGWQADPLCSACATDMITICKGQSADRPEMEKWYLRAILTDRDNFQACGAKLDYLLPKWHGSAEEALDFGEQCVVMGNGHNRIPLIMVDALLDLRDLADDPAGYMATPGVWVGISAAYDKLLANSDDLTTHRARYLQDRADYLNYAFQCRQWEAMLKLLDQFGAEVDLDTLGGKDRLAFYRQHATEHLQKRKA